MSPSERAAIKGVLADLLPEVAIEIGTAEGGSLRRIAERALHVHAFDLTGPAPELAALPNVTFHVGDSHELLRRVLDQLTTSEINVDFVLVDGDHSGEGVKRDVEDLLSSPAISQTLILLHDTANPRVRAGLNAINYRSCAKLTWVDLDWLPGLVFREGAMRGEAWGGLGLLLADAKEGPLIGPARVAEYAYAVTEVLAGRDLPGLAGGHDRHQVEALDKRVEELERLQVELMSSKSWRITRPLRNLSRALGR
jgi:hypothetical protein